MRGVILAIFNRFDNPKYNDRAVSMSFSRWLNLVRDNCLERFKDICVARMLAECLEAFGGNDWSNKAMIKIVQYLRENPNLTDLGTRTEDGVRAGLYRIFHFNEPTNDTVAADDSLTTGETSIADDTTPAYDNSWMYEEYDPDQAILDYWGETHSLRCRHKDHNTLYRIVKRGGTPPKGTVR